MANAINFPVHSCRQKSLIATIPKVVLIQRHVFASWYGASQAVRFRNGSKTLRFVTRYPLPPLLSLVLSLKSCYRLLFICLGGGAKTNFCRDQFQNGICRVKSYAGVTFLSLHHLNITLMVSQTTERKELQSRKSDGDDSLNELVLISLFELWWSNRGWFDRKDRNHFRT